MSLPVRLSTRAEEDLREIVGYYQTKQANLGIKFTNNIIAEKHRIISGNVWLRLARCPSCSHKKFPHVVYYVTLNDRVEVFAIIHGSRDGCVWKSRI